MGILDQIAQPQMADIVGALDLRQKRLDADEARRKEIRMGQLIAEATPNLVPGSTLDRMARESPKEYMVLAKHIGIPLNAGDQIQEFANDTGDLYIAAQADPSAAYHRAIELKQQRNAQGRATPTMDKFIAGFEDDPQRTMTGLFVTHRTLNPPKQGEGFTLGDTRYDSVGNVIATNPRGAGAEQNFRGEIVHGVNGDFVYSGKGNKAEKLLDENGNQVVSAAYDPTNKANIARAVTGAEVNTKQSLDLADKYYQKIAPINNYIANFDDAIRLIDSGAGTGKVESLLPSFRQSSIELDNVRRNLGLNIIQNTTFGALSEGELKLAMDTGLPTGLEGKELKNWISRKRDAQIKMRDYLENAVSYLGEGHSISDLSKLQKQNREGSKASMPAESSPTTSTQGGWGIRPVK